MTNGVSAKEVISLSRFSEFPDALVTLELCRAFAHRDKRRISESLRACSRVLVRKVKNETLRDTLLAMASSQFPETQILRIRDCIRRMEVALERNVISRNGNGK